MRFLSNQIFVIFKQALNIQIDLCNTVLRLKSFVNASLTNTQNREKSALFCACEQHHSYALNRGMKFDHFMAVGRRDSFYFFSAKQR